MRNTLLFTTIGGLGLLLLSGCAGDETKMSDGSATPVRTAEATDAGTAADSAEFRSGKEGSTTTAATDEQESSAPAAPPSFTFDLSSASLPEEAMWKCDPVFEDINEDGYLDLIAHPRLGTGPRVWLGDGAGGWLDSSAGLHMQFSCGGGIDVADLDGDGNLDLAIADHCNGLYVYFGDGGGNWEVGVEQVYPTDLVRQPDLVELHLGSEDLRLGDVNGDGHLDMVAGSSDEGGINVYLGDGTGMNWERNSIGLPTTGWTNRVELADMDGDGRLDIIASYADGPRVYRNMGDNRWEDASDGMPSPMIRGLFRGLSVEDMNKDGRLDIIVANWVDGPEVYYQEEDGSWAKSPDVFREMYGGAQGLDVADLDGDGWLDIVVTGRLERDGGFIRGVFALRNNDGDGTWEFIENSGLPTTGLAAMDGVCLGDVNNDGHPDVAAGSGLITETAKRADAREEPILPQHLLVWLYRPGAASSKAATAGSSAESDGPDVH